MSSFSDGGHGPQASGKDVRARLSLGDDRGVQQQGARPGSWSTDRERGLAIGFVALGLVLFVINLWRNRFFLHDDAFISLRYAQNLATHGELSWNLGDYVEGYTNFLYVLITSGLLWLEMDPVLALRLINAVAVGLLVAGVFYGLRVLVPDRPAVQGFGVALMLGNVSTVVWLLGGLEAPLAAAFVTWGVVFVLRALWAAPQQAYRICVWAGVSFALAVLTRPDGVIVVAATAVAVLVVAPGPWRGRLGKALVVAGIPFVIALIHMGWRVSYYGDLVPNTFHAKVGLDLSHRLGRVGPYILKSALVYLPVLSCAGLGLLVAVALGRLTRPQTRPLTHPLIGPLCLLAAVTLAFLGYVIWSGGDHMAAARVLLPLCGPAALLAALTLAGLRSQSASGFAALCLALLLVATLNARAFRMDWAAFNGTLIGRHIEQSWPAGSLVALNTAGSTPFFGASHRYIDMLGLNDRSIATRKDVPRLARRQAMPGHGKGDGAYVLRRAPDFMILGGAEGIATEEAHNWFLTGVELRALPEFALCYRKQQVTLEVPADLARSRPTAGPVQFTYYKRSCP